MENSVTVARSLVVEDVVVVVVEAGGAGGGGSGGFLEQPAAPKIRTPESKTPANAGAAN